ncbi:hypothetical protein KY284_020103 [Solanum tuberosum]|nr:hypothetical protein KY284_020103 [Solanum tuberosum]
MRTLLAYLYLKVTLLLTQIRMRYINHIQTPCCLGLKFIAPFHEKVLLTVVTIVMIFFVLEILVRVELFYYFLHIENSGKKSLIPATSLDQFQKQQGIVIGDERKHINNTVADVEYMPAPSNCVIMRVLLEK